MEAKAGGAGYDPAIYESESYVLPVILSAKRLAEPDLNRAF